MTSSLMASNAQVLIRSRTLLFLSFRDTRSSYYPPKFSRSKGKQRQQEDSAEQEALLGNQHDSVEVDVEESTSALPPKWVDFSEQVEELIEKIKPKLVQLDKLTVKHVLPGFNDRSSEERQIEALTQEITKGFRRSQLLIRKISDYGSQMEAHIHQFHSQKHRQGQPRFANRDVTLAKNAQIALATKVQNMTSLFQKRQRVYLQQLKGFRDGSPGDKTAIFAIEDDSHGDVQGSTGYLDGPQSQQQQQHKEALDHQFEQDLLEHRDKEIAGIAQSLSELADMFKDLQNLVLDQGTLLDRIDYNVEQMSVDVQGAVQELKVATEYQKRSGKCRIIFLLLLLIFGAILVLIYKPRRVLDADHHGSSS
ncbi:hypothetical protein O181_037931 [Austropuccinia psidii MF-1]|uniref:t-SNARE coiled-coil homology domain-containing protein n=1 Tax=Austropuccinia psidii MF-1 TaxID=1389203 RepID=A0A9Q3DD25_9BASI|nr:hypothetical protein [Austropuccinia psidii MF-1]